MTAMAKVGWSDPAKAGPMLAKIPLGRFAEVEDVVGPVLYLLSGSKLASNSKKYMQFKTFLQWLMEQLIQSMEDF